MSVSRPQYLLATLLALFAAHGLAPEHFDPWRGWVTFKQFVRQVDELPDQGISVQLTTHPAEGETRLFFVRQLLAPDGDRLEPVGGVVCELAFLSRDTPRADWEAWSFDYPSFERFVDVVEQHSPFAELVTERPYTTAVYWEEA